MECGHRVACRQLRHLDTPRVEERAGPDDEGVGLLAPNDFEGGIDLAASIRVEHLDLQSHGASRRLHVSQRDLGQRSKGWIDQHGHTSCGGHQLAQEFEPLCYQFTPEPIDTCQVAARPRQTSNEPKLDRVFAADKNDRDRRGCRLNRECGGNPGGSPEAARKALNKSTILEMHRAFNIGGRKAIEKVMKQQPAVFLKLLVLLVPREMKVEQSNAIKAMSDERIEAAIEYIEAALEAQAQSAKVIEGEAEVVPSLPAPVAPKPAL